MATNIGIRALRARLAAVLDAVRGGDVYAVTRHGADVAYIVPPSYVRKVERADRLAGQLAEAEDRRALAETRLSTAEAERDAARMGQLTAQSRVDELAEEVTALRDLTDGRSQAERRAARRRR
ncbi:type II toxin-antitoxin system Phd/YefM family antitoxin [Streptomyces scabiei]|uniref:type II toxin-antitoxin system Phd/YefM family antitoxin n=1 Tax=Streptomyces scabiei TaxID=1930 RepID=UPI003796D6D0